MLLLEFIENLPYASLPTTYVNDDNSKNIKESVLENSHIGIRQIAEDLSISQDILVNFWK